MLDPLRPPSETLETAWADRVRANREQVDRFREAADGPDFYAPIASAFRANPFRTDEPALAHLRSLIVPGERWLDVGAGGGRYALPIALIAGEVVAVEPSLGMTEVLREGMSEHRISNIRTEPVRWPQADVTPFRADVSFIAHVSYDIEKIGPFLDALEAAATRLCVAMLLWRQPTAPIDLLWPAVHGEPRATLPALPEFLNLLIARNRPFELRLATSDMLGYESVDAAISIARRQTWVKEGSDKDRHLVAVVTERLSERNGRYAFNWDPIRVGVVSWAPSNPVSTEYRVPGSE